MKIEATTPADVNAFLDHLERLVCENEKAATPIFSNDEPTCFERQPRKALIAWATPLEQRGWIRNWVVRDGAAIVGHVQVDGLGGARERASISIAIEQNHQGKGIGQRLMMHAISWAREQSRFESLELGVFGDNHAALSLYRKIGFQVTTVEPARFCLGGKNFDQVRMSLKLTRAAGRTPSRPGSDLREFSADFGPFFVDRASAVAIQEDAVPAVALLDHEKL